MLMMYMKYLLLPPSGFLCVPALKGALILILTFLPLKWNFLVVIYFAFQRSKRIEIIFGVL